MFASSLPSPELRDLASDESVEKALAYVKRHIIRKKYKIKQLDESYLTNYKTELLGNDPLITGIEKFQADEKGRPVIIGTSGLRSILLACQLGNQAVNKAIPLLILIDNSKLVLKLWRDLRLLALRACERAESEFMEDLLLFLANHSDLYVELYSREEVGKFFTDLFEKYGYHYVLSIITNAQIIAQNWCDKALFKTIKNILDFLETENKYTYPSNILFVTESVTLSQQLLENIFSIKPRVSIQTDLDVLQRKPLNFFLLDSSEPSHVVSTLFPQRPRPQEPHVLLIGENIFGLYDPADREAVEFLIRTYGSAIQDRLVQCNKIYSLSDSSLELKQAFPS